MRATKKIFAAGAALLTAFSGAALPCIYAVAEEASAADSEAVGTVHISTAEDLISFSAACVSDKNSLGKKYILDNDISLMGVDFRPIPSFSGEFDGNGHVISNLKITAEGSGLGLFRYIEKKGAVKDLRVTGNILPGGTAEGCGGIAAVNRGRISGCSFSGVIKGNKNIGGIAGINEESGLITACTAEGVVHADISSGGIAGKNSGNIISCENLALINTEISDESFSITDISLEDLGLTGRSADVSDTGGIAGYSEGSIRSCSNKGKVGYSHVGYNVGGIAGRQSGYISGCTNFGEINGRKDIGGIAGQAEPYTSVFYAEKKIETLRTELNALSDSLETAVNHAEERSDVAGDDIDHVIGNLDRIKASADNFADEAERIINYDVDSINEVSSRVTDLTEMLSPAADSLAEASDSLSSSLDLITEAVDHLKNSMESMDKGFDELSFVADDLNDAVTKFRDASDALDESLASLERALGDPDAMDRYLDDLSKSLDDMGDALKGLGETGESAVSSFGRFFENTSEKINEYKPMVMEALAEISKYAGSSGQSFYGLSDSVSDFSGALQDGSVNGDNYNDYLNNIGNSVHGITDSAASEIFRAFGMLADALYGMMSEGFEYDYGGKYTDEALRRAFDEAGKNLGNTGNAADGLFGALSDITGQADALSFNNMVEYLRSANSDIDESADYIQNIIDAFDAAGDYLDEGYISALAAVTALSEASDDIRSAADELSEALSRTADTLDYFASLDAVDFIGADEKLTDCGDLLGDNVQELLDLLEGVSDNGGDTSDIIADDLRDVNSKARSAYNTLIDIISDLGNTSTDIEDYTEDISAQDGHGFSKGKIASCVNRGDIFGDVNAGGITGTMGVDLEFDPENDIKVHGDRSIDFTVKSKTVTRDSVNYGDVTSKKDGAGGIAGSMETGCLINCTAYGFITSTDGNYVGGAAGRSTAAVHGCCVMAHLSGGDYVGGICGTAKDMRDCISYVIIDESGEFTGLSAGYADMYSEDNTINGNAFVDISLKTGERSIGAVDGVSYDGRAFPVSYEEMAAGYDVPEDFTDLKLKFTADGKTVDTLRFSFGDTLTEDMLPVIPHKNGYYSKWEETDGSTLVFSEEIKAEYEKYITAAASAEKRGDRPVFVLEGKFGIDDKIYAAASGGSMDSCTDWTLTIPETEARNTEFVVRYLTAGDPSSVLLKITADGVPVEPPITVDGSCLVFRVSGSEIKVTETANPAGAVTLTVSLAAAGAVLLIIALVLRKKRKKKSGSGAVSAGGEKAEAPKGKIDNAKSGKTKANKK